MALNHPCALISLAVSVSFCSAIPGALSCPQGLLFPSASQIGCDRGSGDFSLPKVDCRHDCRGASVLEDSRTEVLGVEEGEK